MEPLRELPESAFEKEVLSAPHPVLVEFSNDGCGLCKLIAPALEQIADEYADEVRIFIVDTDKSPGLAERYNVQSVPQIFAFTGGKVRERVIGNVSRGRLAQIVEHCLGLPS